MKPWYKSKTVWANVFTLISSGALVLTPLQEFIPSINYAIALSVVALGNIGLRLITTGPVGR
jgi:hypothetical protein